MKLFQGFSRLAGILKKLLVHVKDPVPMEMMNGVVYQI